MSIVIKRDNFKLFDLSIHQKYLDKKLTLKKEIQSFNFSFCNLTGYIFQSLLDNKYYIGICTEAEYYQGNPNCTNNIIRRYLMLPVPREFIISNKINSFVAQEYLQLILDDYFLHKKISNHEFFIFDECIADQYLSRIYYPNKDTMDFYFNYVFETERYFLEPYNEPLNYTNKQFENSYIYAKNDNLETTISEYLKNQLVLNVNTSNIFPFKEESLKVFKTFFKSKFTSHTIKNKDLLLIPNQLNFGFFETQDKLFYLFIQTENLSSSDLSIERYILIPSTQEQSYLFATSDYVQLNEFVIQYLNKEDDITIFEHNISHPNFNFIYEVSNQSKIEYLKFLRTTFEEQVEYCLKHNNTMKLIELNELPYSHTISQYNSDDLFDKFNLPKINFSKKSLVHTVLQQEHTFIHQVTGAKYYLNTLLFSNNKEQLEFNDIYSFFSRSISENVLIYKNKIIGFIQQQKLFSISNEEFNLIRGKNHSNKFLIEDMIDDYECMFNKIRYSMFYIEFVDNNTVYKISLLVENEEQNVLQEAQTFLNAFMKQKKQNN